MASGTAGWNAGAYGDDGWDDGILLSETGIAATLAVGVEVASGSALISQVGYDTFRISLADLSSNITGTALINTATGSSIASSIGTAKLWSLINTTSGGTETWTVGTAN